MGLSYTEELVSEYFGYKMDENGRPEYMVSEHAHFNLRRRKRELKDGRILIY
jgi:hypothetical protein